MNTLLLTVLFSLETELEPTFALDLDEGHLAEAEEERKLVCCRCGTLITFSDEAIQIYGFHQHLCTNPYGERFNIGCFRTAQGCSHSGEQTEQYTWFPGYSWSVAHCVNCHEHLGWRYDGREKHFHGLILNKITHPRPY